MDLVERAVTMLGTKKSKGGVQENDQIDRDLKITVLSPYTKQIQELRHRLPSSVPCFTVDSFQGRESDIIIFTTVRSNAEHDIGFVDDARRLNVMWTRARLGLIIIADKDTMGTNALWRRALEACTEISLSAETEPSSSV